MYRDNPNQYIYGKGSTAQVLYYPYDITDCGLYPPTMYAVPRYTCHIGFMIKGAPNISFDLEYSYTYEYVSSNNTDLVPCTYGPVGEVSDILSTENNLNRAIPSGPDSVNKSVSDSIAKAWSIAQRTI